MLSYMHRYHAGCFADIHKHLILIAILDHLQKKPSPFGVLDTHAGEGLYDLKSEQSQLNKEYQQGFNIIAEAKNPPALIQKLLDTAKFYQSQMTKGRFYPGSAALIQRALREQDSAIFIEKHPQSYRALERNLGIQKNIHIHARDAYEAMNAFVPLKEKRGLIFIDPSFEVKSEYEQSIDAIIKSYQKFPTGIFAIWYPILNPARHTVILQQLKKSGIEKVWRSEWTPFKNIFQEGILGSGMIVINPPWGLAESVDETLRWMKGSCYPGSVFFMGDRT
jgi:23S rRNA (adenine2030-N6)-methyltransferase